MPVSTFVATKEYGVMTSLRARLFILLLKHRHLLRARLRRETIDASTSIAHLRARTERSAQRRFGTLPPGLEAVPTTIGSMHAEWIRTANAPIDRVLLYFHGGGYVMGSAASHRAVVAKFVAGVGINALLFEYRLAPEHPFPSALQDALSAYDYLRRMNFATERIAFVGDSAGGGLCLATLLALRDAGQPLPAGAALLSPWTDLTCSGQSYRRRDPVAPDGSWQTFATLYSGDHDRASPLISPLYGELAALPRLLIHAGADEAMCDDARQFAHKAQVAGVDVQLRIAPGMVHCYPLFAPLFPEARQAMDEICTFLRECVAT